MYNPLIIVIIKVAQIEKPFEVRLTSSVAASNRTFACRNEEVVYHCVAETRMMNNSNTFYTKWLWNTDPEPVIIFNSMQQTGTAGTCTKMNSTENRPYLYLALVSTTPTTCVSLLVVIPSLTLSNYRDGSAMIGCLTHGVSAHPSNNQTINHNTLSGKLCMM